MKTKLSVALFALLLSLSLAAQPSLSAKLIADIPFDFGVANRQLPAGSYIVAQDQQSGLVWLQHVNSPKELTAVLALRSGARRPDGPVGVLTFRKYDSQRFLAEVWAFDQGQQLLQSRKERELVTSKLYVKVKPETVLVAAKMQ